MEEHLAVAEIQTSQDEMRKLLSRDPHGSISCHYCNGPNHFEKNCKGLHTRRWTPRIQCYKCNAVGHISCNCLGNEPRIGLGASLLPKPHTKEALPTIAKHINGIRSIALLDMGCSQLPVG